MCTGYGHHVKQCGTYRSMNRYATGTKTLKSAWGTVKGTYITS